MQSKASGAQRGSGQRHARHVPSRDWWPNKQTSDARKLATGFLGCRGITTCLLIGTRGFRWTPVFPETTRGRAARARRGLRVRVSAVALSRYGGETPRIHASMIVIERRRSRMRNLRTVARGFVVGVEIGIEHAYLGDGVQRQPIAL